MSLTFEENELNEARRVNRLLASAPRVPLRTPWDVAVINGALSLSHALPAGNLKRHGVLVEDRRVEAGGRDAMVRILRPAGPAAACTSTSMAAPGCSAARAWTTG